MAENMLNLKQKSENKYCYILKISVDEIYNFSFISNFHIIKKNWFQSNQYNYWKQIGHRRYQYLWNSIYAKNENDNQPIYQAKNYKNCQIKFKKSFLGYAIVSYEHTSLFIQIFCFRKKVNGLCRII